MIVVMLDVNFESDVHGNIQTMIRALSIQSAEERIPAPPVPRSEEDSDNVSRILTESFDAVVTMIESFRDIAAFNSVTTTFTGGFEYRHDHALKRECQHHQVHVHKRIRVLSRPRSEETVRVRSRPHSAQERIPAVGIVPCI